jgi:hypothetical protein
MTIHNYLRKQLPFLLSSILVIFSLASCQKQPDLQFGSTYTNDNNGANIVVVDTSTVLVSTTYIDSAATNGTGFLMVGDYDDSYLGNVRTRAFLQVAPPGSLPQLSIINDGYDSIGMILFYKRGNPFYGDTTVSPTYVVNQVSELYQLPGFQFAYESNTALPIDPNELGRATANIAPNHPTTNVASAVQGDTVKIKMDDDIGKRIYNMVLSNTDTVRNAVQFINWFHGLRIATDSITGQRGVIYGFQDSAIMRIYYHEAGALSTIKFIDFGVTNKGLQFNNVRTTGPLVSTLNKPSYYGGHPLATRSDTLNMNHAGYVASISGMNVKLNFPYLNSIAQRPDFIGLLRATLIVRPVPGSFSPIWRLPPQVSIFTTDQNNLELAAVPAIGASGAQTGNLLLDYYNPLNTQYTFDVTAYIKTAITSTAQNVNQTGLLLTIPASANVAAFNRLIVADQSFPIPNRVTLNVYYIALFPHN